MCGQRGRKSVLTDVQDLVVYCVPSQMEPRSTGKPANPSNDSRPAGRLIARIHQQTTSRVRFHNSYIIPPTYKAEFLIEFPATKGVDDATDTRRDVVAPQCQIQHGGTFGSNQPLILRQLGDSLR